MSKNKEKENFRCSYKKSQDGQAQGFKAALTQRVIVGLPPVHTGAGVELARQGGASDKREMVALVRRGLCNGT